MGARERILALKYLEKQKRHPEFAKQLGVEVKMVETKKGGESMYYTTGEKPGKGTYKCITCGVVVVLDDNTDTLPPCPKCHNTTFRKVK